MFTYS